MLNFYKIVKDNLSFNRFEYEDTVCLEYSCPIESEVVSIYSKCDYVVHVLSGKKTYKTINGEWTVSQGETLYVKKGAEVIQQYFDDEYCMLGFFVTDDLIKRAFEDARGKVPVDLQSDFKEFTVSRVETSEFLEVFFHSMLNYFRGINRPPDQIMMLKLKELLLTIMNCDKRLTTYFENLSTKEGPSLRDVMEKNFCYNLKLEDYAELCHCSLSSFKRAFNDEFEESPGKWLLRKRIDRASEFFLHSNQSLTQIAFENGFEDLSHFSRSFKKLKGLSPSEFKRQAISKV